MKTFLNKFMRPAPVSGTQLQPWDLAQMTSLVKKLNVSPKDLNDAIIDTGSLDLNFIKAYLKRKGVTFSFKRLFITRQFANN